MLVQELAPLLQRLPGLVFVEYPVVPTNAYKTICKTTNIGQGAGCSGQHIDIDDEDVSDVDFGVDSNGALPEAVTQSVARLTRDMKASALAQDQFEILQALGFTPNSHKYPKPVTLTFADTGPVAVRHGFILVPMDSVQERAPNEFDLTGLGQTRLQQVGSFVGIENPSTFIESSKKLAAKLRREMDDDESWQSVVPTTPSVHLVANKSLRSQNGYQCYKTPF